MEVDQSLFNLLSRFNSNWKRHQNRLLLTLSGPGNEIIGIDSHPLSGELTNLINGSGGSLPFFKNTDEVTWLTLAPDSLCLQIIVNELRAWILPSFGWQGSNDGYLSFENSNDPFQQAISKISPCNYYRWRCDKNQYPIIEGKLATRYQLEQSRPKRSRIRRPSLYELRIQFQTALTIGNRELAEHSIRMIDSYELDKALNTSMMRIHLWHHFREFGEILSYHHLDYVQAQPSLPSAIKQYIRDAGVEEDQQIDVPIENEPVTTQRAEFPDDWEIWFELLIDQHDAKSARSWLNERTPPRIEDLDNTTLETYMDRWDQLFVDDQIKEQNKSLINESMIEFLGDFVREPEFPRTNLAGLYLSLLRLWGEMNGGIGRGREEGHVLLELSNALFELNYSTDDGNDDY